MTRTEKLVAFLVSMLTIGFVVYVSLYGHVPDDEIVRMEREYTEATCRRPR